MSQSTNIERAAEEIYVGIKRGRYFPPAWRGQLTLDDAYRVQLAIRALRAADGDAPIGWKVGLTAKVIQELENFAEPIFAGLHESGRLASGATLPFEDLIKPAFENELCIVLGEALEGPGVTMARARAAIATVAPALELVEGRGVLSEDPSLAVADNLGQRGFVTGPAMAPPPDFVLADTRCIVSVNGEQRGEGDGSAVLDDPAHAVAWLANKLATFGLRIEAGQPIMSGSFTVPISISAGDRVETLFEPFGRVAVSFQ